MAASKSASQNGRQRGADGRYKKGGGGGSKGGSGRGRGSGHGRSRNGASAGAGTGGGAASAKALAAARAAGARAARAAAAQNGSKRGKGKGRGRSSRNGSTSPNARNPLSMSGFGGVLKQLGYGGAGAFTVSTLTMLVPIPLTSPFIILLVQGVLAWVTGWLGGKLFGRQNEETVRIGAFAYVAGNAINLLFPNLQQTILEYSPIKAGPRAMPSRAAQGVIGNGQMVDTQPQPLEPTQPMSDIVYSDSDVDQMADIGAGYLGDISVVPQGHFAYGAGNAYR